MKTELFSKLVGGSIFSHLESKTGNRFMKLAAPLHQIPQDLEICHENNHWVVYRIKGATKKKVKPREALELLTKILMHCVPAININDGKFAQVLNSGAKGYDNPVEVHEGICDPAKLPTV